MKATYQLQPVAQGPMGLGTSLPRLCAFACSFVCFLCSQMLWEHENPRLPLCQLCDLGFLAVHLPEADSAPLR